MHELLEPWGGVESWWNEVQLGEMLGFRAAAGPGVLPPASLQKLDRGVVSRRLCNNNSLTSSYDDKAMLPTFLPRATRVRDVSAKLNSCNGPTNALAMVLPASYSPQWPRTSLTFSPDLFTGGLLDGIYWNALSD